MSDAKLLEEWSDLLERRPTFREALGHYAGILTAWSRWPSHRIVSLRWSVDEGYLKELDRRVRWNAGSALIEDWSSPHLDLTAHRTGYWRPIPTLVEVTAPA